MAESLSKLDQGRLMFHTAGLPFSKTHWKVWFHSIRYMSLGTRGKKHTLFIIALIWFGSNKIFNVSFWWYTIINAINYFFTTAPLQAVQVMKLSGAGMTTQHQVQLYILVSASASAINIILPDPHLCIPSCLTACQVKTSIFLCSNSICHKVKNRLCVQAESA